MRMRMNWPGAVCVLVVIGAWQLTTSVGFISKAYVSSPVDISKQAWALADAGPLFGYIGHTAAVTVVSWLVAAIAGAAIGVAMGLWLLPRRLFLGPIEFLRNIPAVTFVPLAVLLFGFSATGEFAVAVFAGIWPVVLAGINGIDRLPQRYVDVGRTLGLRDMTFIRKIAVPGALGELYIGARVSLTICLVIVVVSEMLGNPTGLGYGLVQEGQAINTPGVFCYLLMIGLLAVVLNALFRKAWVRYRPWDVG
jgi:sulfonate transport system permease protein